MVKVLYLYCALTSAEESKVLYTTFGHSLIHTHIRSLMEVSYYCEPQLPWGKSKKDARGITAEM